jgi:D-methionine transport system substrate-binding protein
MKILELVLVPLLLVGCHVQDKTLTVAATPTPHAEILEAVKPELEKEGIHLKVVEVDDYNLPNRLLYEKQVDANFFQHEPYLDEQNKRFDYHLKALVAVHVEPLGVYSCRITSIEDLQEGARIAIPNDPTNEARALDLLANLGLIQLKPSSENSLATVYSILKNPKKLRLEEVDAPFLPRILHDVDAAVIPANYALQAHLNPLHDALALESSNSPYANVVAVREGDEALPAMQALKQALTTEQMRAWLLKKYQGAVIPAF